MEPIYVSDYEKQVRYNEHKWQRLLCCWMNYIQITNYWERNIRKRGVGEREGKEKNQTEQYVNIIISTSSNSIKIIMKLWSISTH